jgi:hypothetical protein
MRSLGLSSAAIAAALAFATLPTSAAPVTAATLSGGSLVDAAYNIELGFGFTPTANLQLTALGMSDPFANGNVGAVAKIGLYTQTGIELKTLTVSAAGSYVESGFRYVDLAAAVDLSAGTDYVVLAFYGTGASGIDLLPSASFDARISNVHYTNTGPLPDLAWLGVLPGGIYDYPQFGSNFKFEAQPVPEPASWLLVIAGGSALAIARRRRRG